ncbi:MAG: GNAT family N-acetyltransferase [Actinomycetota bacterium]
MDDHTTWSTKRLVLTQPTTGDLDAWHTIHADPRVWEHFPSGRHAEGAQSEAALHAAIDDWQADGLGYWSVRAAPDGPIIGCGGCRRVPADHRWNLYYRFTPESQGNGYATELARASIAAANTIDPGLPVVAYMLEHNTASWRVAERIGMHRLWTGPDAGNPDPAAVRLVYADRDDDSTAGIGRT